MLVALGWRTSRVVRMVLYEALGDFGPGGHEPGSCWASLWCAG